MIVLASIFAAFVLGLMAWEELQYKSASEYSATEDFLAMFAAFVLVVLAGHFLAIDRWVSAPLTIISESLVTQDTSRLSGLSTHNTEFGELAGLVSAFFAERKCSEREIIRLNRHLEARLGRIEALRRIDMAINANHDLSSILNVVLREVREQLCVAGSAMLLLDDNTGRLRYACVSGVQFTNINHASAAADAGLAGEVAANGSNLFIEDVASDPKTAAALDYVVGEAARCYYGLPLISRGKTKGVIEVFNRSKLSVDREWLDFLEALAGQAAIAIENTNLFEGLQHTNIELEIAYDATIEGWSRALDLRDKETEGHSQRVTEMTVRLAGDLGITGDELLHIRRGALLHDIGKMGIPDQILLKPGPLSDDEWEIMRMHPVFAYEMLSPIEFLVPALDIPHCHHEKWDGTGYPRGLRGEQIPVAARIFAVIDVWDALRSDRPYRPGWPKERVKAHIIGGAGTHFDPKVVAAFEHLLEEQEIPVLKAA